jgi:hypothetical protein
MRQHQHPSIGQVDAMLLGEALDVLSDRQVRAAEVIAGPEGCKRADRPRQPGRVIEVDQPQPGALAERVPQRLAPDMADPAGVDGRSGGGHQEPPSESAAATPDLQPSSWNPQPW